MNGSERSDHSGAEDGPWARLRENATGITSLLVTAFWLGAMFTGQEWWIAALLVGYVAIVPLVAILFGDEDDQREWADDYLSADTAETDAEPEPPTDSKPDALETLRERYAAGELTDEQFERKLERLLDTETLEEAQEWAQEQDRDRTDDRERDLEYDR